MGFDEERPVGGIESETDDDGMNVFSGSGESEKDFEIVENPVFGEENFESAPKEPVEAPYDHNLTEGSIEGQQGIGSTAISGDQEPKPVSMSFLEIIYGVLAEPKATFRYLGTAKPFLKAAVFVILLALFNFLLGAGELSKQLKEAGSSLPFGGVDMSGFVGIFAVMAVFYSLMGWFTFSAIVSLFAQLWGGKGNGKGLLSAFAFGFLPMMISAILEFGGNAIGLGAFFKVLVSLAGLIWMIVLQIWAVREIEELSLGRSCLAYFAFPVIIIVVLIVFFVLFIASFGPLLQQFSTMSP